MLLVYCISEWFISHPYSHLCLPQCPQQHLHPLLLPPHLGRWVPTVPIPRIFLCGIQLPLSAYLRRLSVTTLCSSTQSIPSDSEITRAIKHTLYVICICIFTVIKNMHYWYSVGSPRNAGYIDKELIHTSGNDSNTSTGSSPPGPIRFSLSSYYTKITWICILSFSLLYRWNWFSDIV